MGMPASLKNTFISFYLPLFPKFRIFSRFFFSKVCCSQEPVLLRQEDGESLLSTSFLTDQNQARSAETFEKGF